MYNLLEYSKNYRKTKNQVSVDEPSNHLSSNSESFKYKISIVGKTPQSNDSFITNAKVVITLKYLSRFWRSLNISLINCEVELILTWSKNCVLADMTVDADADLTIVARSGAKFKIRDTKLFQFLLFQKKMTQTF